MTRTCLRGFLLAISLMIISTIASAQLLNQPLQFPAKRPLQAQTPNSGGFTFTECEGNNHCAIWTFPNRKGSGKWSSGEEATLEVTVARDRHIVIQRTDVAGPRQGLTATYTGDLSGNGDLGGTYQSSYHGQTDSGSWYWSTQTTPSSPPSVLHFCDTEHCETLNLTSGEYVVEMPNNCCSSHSVWTIMEFDSEWFVLHRQDASGFSSYYKGQISTEGNSLVNTVSGSRPYNSNWSPGSDTRNSNFQITWGSALNTLSGNDFGRNAGFGWQPRQTSVSVGQTVPGAQNGRDASKLFYFFSGLN